MYKPEIISITHDYQTDKIDTHPNYKFWELLYTLLHQSGADLYCNHGMLFCQISVHHIALARSETANLTKF